MIFQGKAEGCDCPVTAEKFAGTPFFRASLCFFLSPPSSGGWQVRLEVGARGLNSIEGRKEVLGRYVDKSRFSISSLDQVNRVVPFPTLMHPGWHRNVSLKSFYIRPSFLRGSKERGRALSPLNDVKPASCVPRQCRSLYLLLALLLRLPWLLEVFILGRLEPEGDMGRGLTLSQPFACVYAHV